MNKRTLFLKAHREARRLVKAFKVAYRMALRTALKKMWSLKRVKEAKKSNNIEKWAKEMERDNKIFNAYLKSLPLGAEYGEKSDFYKYYMEVLRI